MEKYLYFRTQATLGSDDGSGDSALYPLSSLCGMVPSAADTLNLYFKPMIPVQADGQDGAVINNDKVKSKIAELINDNQSFNSTANSYGNISKPKESYFKRLNMLGTNLYKKD